jgi:hypothetical protein
MSVSIDHPSITSIGLPPEKHADRVVAGMMRIMARDRARCWPKIQEVIQERIGKDGNRCGQEKLLKRLKEVLSGFLLYSDLTPGKRGRFTIFLVVLDAWDAERRDLIRENDRIPEKPWLALSVIRIVGKGHRKYDQDGSFTMFITHHSLSRLTQRCGARTLKEVFGSVRAIARAHCVKRLDTSFQPDGAYYLHVDLPYGLGGATCAIEPYDDEKGGEVCATLWKDEVTDTNQDASARGPRP